MGKRLKRVLSASDILTSTNVYLILSEFCGIISA